MAQPTHPEDRNVTVTTAAVNEGRHLVRPYDDRPVVDMAKGVVGCLYCANPQFRRSRLRFTDVIEILMLRYPVRCTRCGQRQFTDFNVAMISLPPRPVGRPTRDDHEAWKNWTGPSVSGQRLARSLSTATGARTIGLEANPRPSSGAMPAHTAARNVDGDIW